jgi:flavin-dependent thymidylate synthase
MKCTLVNYTTDAADLLIFAKQTRLNMSPGLLAEIRAWPEEKKDAELAYIANSIPSSWEFVDYTFMIEGVSRAFTHQQVRTRHGSYAQQSLRVVDASDFDFVMPSRFATSEFPEERQLETYVGEIVGELRGHYRDLLAAGATPEEARSILPTNVATNILAKFNLRTLSELCRARVGKRVSDEYVSVVFAMRDAVEQVHPWAIPFLRVRHADLADAIDEWAIANVPTGEKRRDLLKLADRLRQER